MQLQKVNKAEVVNKHNLNKHTMEQLVAVV